MEMAAPTVDAEAVKMSAETVSAVERAAANWAEAKNVEVAGGDDTAGGHRRA